MRKFTITSDNFIAIVCYSLIGRRVEKIKFDTLNMLCNKALKEFNQPHSKFKIAYTNRSLLNFIQLHKNKYADPAFDKKLQIQIFSSYELNIIHFLEINEAINNINKIITTIPHSAFLELYPIVNDLINQYQFLELVEDNETCYDYNY